MVPWAHPSLHPKRHVGRCGRFVGLALATNKHADTDTDTDHETSRHLQQ